MGACAIAAALAVEESPDSKRKRYLRNSGGRKPTESATESYTAFYASCVESKGENVR